MMSDASDMLAAALEQMDGIIAGSKALDYSNGMFDCQSPTSPFMGNLRALHLLEDLRSVLELMDDEEQEGLRCQIPHSTALSLGEWLQGHLSNGHISLSGGDQYQERLTRLESDKESLVLQVSVLTDQVDAQGEKIRDLDVCLEDNRDKLNSTEEMLQQELLCRASLETQKLELMSEVSSLKLKLNAIEKERRDLDRFGDSEELILEVNELRYRLQEMESDRIQYEKKLKSTKSLMAKLSCLKMKVGQMHYERQRKELNLQAMKEELAALRRQQENGDGGPRRAEAGPERVLFCVSDVEVQRMKKAVESLMAANEEKDRKIEELKQSALRSRRLQDAGVQGKRGGTHRFSGKGVTSCFFDFPLRLRLLYDFCSRAGNLLMLCLPSTVGGGFNSRPTVTDSIITSTAPYTTTLPVVSCPPKNKANEEMSKLTEKPPAGGSATLPGPLGPPADDSFGSRKGRSSFGKGFFKLRGGKRTTSTPNLAEVERPGTEHLDLAGLPQRSPTSDSTHTLPTTPETGKKKATGIKRLFGKLRRSQSTTFNLDDNLSEGEFKRGGVRSTAGPRLGWSRDLQHTNSELDAPFARWSKEQVCEWLKEQGLGLYGNMARVWVSSGQTLLQASQQDLERELGIKHPLHRKKLQLALQALGSEEEDNKSKLDYNWVTRWLDDIGLPQYKTQFDEGRVDGRMLHYMTVDDLLSLKVGSVLHHLSIKRAIQVLRLNHYQPNCLRRRPSHENNISPAEVSQWTNHRVMEWLRSVDLAEYAPNLRGSGVHGGLMVLEPRFNVETMALLLNIPPNKTLLRRHLATHFSVLVGLEAQQLKQESLEHPDYLLLTATAKVKPKKAFGGFGTLRRKRQEDSEEYVCPMDVEMPKGRSFQRGYGGELQIYEDDLDRLEQMEDSEGTVRQIGAFSEEIQNLTSMLKEDEFFKEESYSPNPSVTDEESTA
uniref:PPFIA binding protein 1b n=1 Tax=Gadus morhua TaxID=8049 RepID=A0A8C5BIZ2_GADMO